MLLAGELEKVDKHIDYLCRSEVEGMQVIMDYVNQAKGKRIRPVLTLLCSKLKGKQVDVTEIASLVEICHTASLIHDDVIDNAVLRRGQLSVQEKFGKEMAVYAGDFMIFSAIGRTHLTNKVWYKKMFNLLEAMCNGELEQFNNRYNTKITEKQYISSIIGKTSAMFEIACKSGAYEGKCNDSELQQIEQFARNLGLVFQLRDDLMDFLTTDKELRKTVNSDFINGYYTLPAIYTFQHDTYGASLRSLADELKTSDLDRHSVTDRISNQVIKSGGIEYTLDKIKIYANKAIRSLDIFKDTVYKQELLNIIDRLVESSCLACKDVIK